MLVISMHFNKLRRCFKPYVKFATPYETKKCAMLCSAKDKIPTHNKPNVVYTIKCPARH